jgi:hypothetical protein
MPVAAPTIDRVESKVTLETLAVNMEQLAIAMNAGFVSIDGRFKALDKKSEFFSLEVYEGFRTLKERLDRIEYATYQIQKDLDQLDQEMKGIHHVLDNFEMRITQLENPP